MNKDHTSHETKNAARRVKLLVVEDSFIVRQRLGALIERIASVDLVGSAEDGTQGLEMFRALQPEAVALDLQLPGLNGFDLLALIKRERPDCLVMVLTTYAEDVCREQCIRLGADYFFNKSSEFERVIEVLEAMASPVRPGAAAPGCSRRSDAHETARLHSLRQHRVLDTQPEPQFDDIARLAALVCDAPISFISLADEQRHWFKARVGIEWSEVARNHAFCDYAIEATGMFVIRDTAADERFARHPLVTAPPHARFYAGVPLRLANGHALGMLAVMDTRPRELTPTQTGALQCLGLQTVALLEHRLASEHLRKREDDYRVLICTAHDGFWLVDAQGRLLDVNEAYCRLTGYSREQLLAMSISDVEAAESPEPGAPDGRTAFSSGILRPAKRYTRARKR